MKSISQLRRENLCFLIEVYGSIAKLNEVLGRNRKDGTLSQIKNGAINSASGSIRNMGHVLARTIEKKLNLDEGWMDMEHPEKIATQQIKNTKYKEKNDVLIPLLDEIPEGSDISNLDDSIQGVKMSDLLIEQYFPNIPKRALRTFRVPDSSGLPKVPKGNYVVVDTRVKKFEGDGWYLVNVQGFKTLKHISFDFRGGYRIDSGETESQFVPTLEYVCIEAKVIFAWVGIQM